MTGNLDDWLNDGVGDDVAKAQGQPTPAPAPQPAQAPVNPATKPAKPPSLKSIGIGRGGVIRNPETKRVTITGNTVTNPKPPSKLSPKQVKEPTPEEELKATNPALAFPSVMTGMDLDTEKRPSNGAVEAPSPPPAPPLSHPTQASPPVSVPLSYESTLRQILMLAVQNGGTLHFGTGEFVLSIQITAPVSKARG